MADVINTSGITGIDGVTPVYDPYARWCWWNINEIFTGAVGESRYVPKINDYVMDSDQYITYIVEAIDPTTLLSTLREIRPNGTSQSFSVEDALFGVGPGTQADTYRVYLDTSVIPHVLAVDARLKVGGSMASYARIFKGSDVSSAGKVISKLYDQGGTLLTQNIPLELASIDSHVNHSIRIVSVCHTSESLNDGEIVTIVIYDDQGHVVSKRQLLVENTGFIRSINSSQKYISHITLDTPFMSATSDGLIEFPLNIPLQALNLMGVVHYSDGSKLRMPVDGTKFRIHGIEQYISTIVGQKIELVLSYSISPTETVYGAVTSDSKFVTAPYNLTTIKTDGSFVVKLFGYPVWIDSINGYTMEWYLYNLDRNVVFNVTQFIRVAQTSPAFNPTGYGLLQRLVYNINLKDVSGSFRSYIHTQSVDIVLKRPADEEGTPWLVGYESSTIKPLYGEGLFAGSSLGTNNQWTINLSSDINIYDEWLNKVYKATYPIIDTNTEITPPLPNYFTLVYNNVKLEFPIDQWDKALNLGTGVVPLANKTIFIQFFKRTPTNDILLSVAGMTIKPIV